MITVGANWKRQRAALAPAFSHSKAEQFNYAITKQTSAFVSYLRGKSQNGVTSDVPIHIEMTRLAFDVIIRCGLGLETSSGEHAEHFHLILEEMQNPFRRYVPYWRVLPTRTNAKLTKAMISLKVKPTPNQLLGTCFTDRFSLSIEPHITCN
jgi:cytochrome P450